MADKTPQTYANHGRIDTPFHFLLLPLSFLAVVYGVYVFFGGPSVVSGLCLVLAIGFMLATFRIRIYSLKVQDRVIRLEERLRLNLLLPETDRKRIGELTENQLIALRFASDGELPALARRAMDEKLSSKQIKGAIENWRPDHFRV